MALKLEDQRGIKPFVVKVADPFTVPVTYHCADYNPNANGAQGYGKWRKCSKKELSEITARMPYIYQNQATGAFAVNLVHFGYLDGPAPASYNEEYYYPTYQSAYAVSSSLTRQSSAFLETSVSIE